MYAADAQESYPLHPDWCSVGGNDGSYYIFTAATNRPLNQHVPDLQVFHCPADHGDFGGDPTNCFAPYGNSYLVQWADVATCPTDPGDLSARYGYRIRSGTGTGTKVERPIKTTQTAGSSANKIVLGDWVWHANRLTTDPRNI